MLKRPVEAEIGLYRVEPWITEVEVELERVALKVDVGTNDADLTVGGTAEFDSDDMIKG